MSLLVGTGAERARFQGPQGTALRIRLSLSSLRTAGPDSLEPRLGQIAQSGVPREQLYIAGSVLSDVSVGERPARLETARACAETSRLSLYP